MKVLMNLKLIGTSVLLVVGLGACDKPGTTENAGRNMNQTDNQADNKMSSMADNNNIGEKMEKQSEKVGVAIDDAGITTKVKAAILEEPNLKSLQISVYTVGGVVTLSGSVDSEASSARAKALASAVEGVKMVENRLMVNK